MGVKSKLARSGWFSDDKRFPPRNLIQKTGECWLWRTVIDRALVDALSTIPSTKADAMDFFEDKTGWFEKVCSMADLTPKEVFGKLAYFIETNKQDRKKREDAKRHNNTAGPGTENT
jgi:hypothetical protein